MGRNVLVSGHPEGEMCWLRVEMRGDSGESMA